MPDVLPLRGYDPRSTTIGITFADGSCMDRFVTQGSIVRFDTAVAPRSGELAAIALRPPGRTAVYTTKQIELVDGRWFMLSFDGWNEFTRNCEVLGKVVHLVIFPAAWASNDPGLRAAPERIPPGYREYQLKMAREVTPRFAQRPDRSTEYPLQRQH